LGFSPKILEKSATGRDYNLRHHVIEAFIVLEHEGDTYRKAVALAQERLAAAKAKAAQAPDSRELKNQVDLYRQTLRRVQHSGTRLYAIDAGRDFDSLAGRYNGKQNHLIIKGEIRLNYGADGPQGLLRNAMTTVIHVPLPAAGFLADLEGNPISYDTPEDPREPRYRVQLNLGKRLEPWITAIKP